MRVYLLLIVVQKVRFADARGSDGLDGASGTSFLIKKKRLRSRF